MTRRVPLQALLSHLWYLAVAWEVSSTWGMLVTFIGVTRLIFLVIHWRVALMPFLMGLLGWVMVVQGIAIGFDASFLAPE